MKRFFRNIKFWLQRRTRGWSNNECWNLDWAFINWINCHLKQYLKDAYGTIDLKFHKFDYNGKEYTQLEIINEMIEISDCLLKDDGYYGTTTTKETDKLLDLFKISFSTLWW